MVKANHALSNSALVVSCPFERHLAIFFSLRYVHSNDYLHWLMCILTVLSNPCHLIWLRVSCCESRLPAYAVLDLDLEIKGGWARGKEQGETTLFAGY